MLRFVFFLFSFLVVFVVFCVSLLRLGSGACPLCCSKSLLWFCRSAVGVLSLRGVGANVMPVSCFNLDVVVSN